MARKPQNLDTLLLSVTNEETKELRAKIVLDILVSGNEVWEQYAKEAAGTYASKKEVGTAALIMEKAGYGPQAKDFYTQAFKLADSPSSKTADSTSSRATLSERAHLAEKAKLYDTAIELWMKLGKPGEAERIAKEQNMKDKIGSYYALVGSYSEAAKALEGSDLIHKIGSYNILSKMTNEFKGSWKDKLPGFMYDLFTRKY